MKYEVKTALLATVATGILLAGNGLALAAEERAPAYNPQIGVDGAPAMQGQYTPSMNPDASVGKDYMVQPQADTVAGLPANDPAVQQAMKAFGTPPPMGDDNAGFVPPPAGGQAGYAPPPPPAPPPGMMPPPPAEKSGGMFSWFQKEPEQPQRPRVDTSQRRAPMLNQQAMQQQEAPQGFGLAAPVEDVQAMPVDRMDAQYRPEQPEQPAAIAGNYPRLSDVPPMPGRLEGLQGADHKADDLTAAREQSTEQRSEVETQIQADQQGNMPDMQKKEPVNSPLQKPQVMEGNDLNAEFNALIAAPVTENPASSLSQAVPSTPSQPQPSEFMPAELPVVAKTAPQPVQTAPSPQPLMPKMAALPQIPVVEESPATAPVQEEWVELTSVPAPHASMPVPQVSVGNAPQPMEVAPAPMQTEWNAGPQIALTPPPRIEKQVHALPESRYAGRRQAVYMNRYERRMQILSNP